MVCGWEANVQDAGCRRCGPGGDDAGRDRGVLQENVPSGITSTCVRVYVMFFGAIWPSLLLACCFKLALPQRKANVRFCRPWSAFDFPRRPWSIYYFQLVTSPSPSPSSPFHGRPTRELSCPRCRKSRSMSMLTHFGISHPVLSCPVRSPLLSSPFFSHPPAMHALSSLRAPST